MRTRSLAFLTIVALLLMASFPALDNDAHARAGGSRSIGSRGTRSYSQPVAPPSQAPSRQYAPSTGTPYQQPYQQPYRQPMGGFGGSFLGSLAGGLLGGMLFRSLGFGGGYGMGHGGIGLFDILLLAGIAYLIFKFVLARRSSAAAGASGQPGKVINMNDYQRQDQGYAQMQNQAYDYGQVDARGDVEQGISYIRQMDPAFDESRFNDNVMDIFFKIQGAWMNRDLSGVSNLLTDEMRGIMQGDVDTLLKEKRVNRLENIAVRTVEVSEAWQETGRDYITALIYANLLDYTTDDTTGAVVQGSKTDPVKFEEFWTFTRPVGNHAWQLSAINQR